MKECCKTCKKFYIEYGWECCKVWEDPMENTEEDKCSQYECYEYEMEEYYEEYYRTEDIV